MTKKFLAEIWPDRGLVVGLRQGIAATKSTETYLCGAAQGGATATAEDGRDDAVVTTVYDIAEAAILADDKIKIAFRVATVTRSDSKAASQSDHDNVDIVFQRARERIEVTRIQFEGLPEVERAIFYEKCPTPAK